MFYYKEWLFDDGESSNDLVCAGNSYDCVQVILEAEGNIEFILEGELNFEIFRLVPKLCE